MGLISDIIGGIGTVAQGFINAGQQRKNIRAENEGNLALAKYQYNNQLDMWNKANQYNTPAAQMQRFKDAGLNPNLIYGQGSSGNSPNVLPQYHAPSQRYDVQPSLNIPQVLSMYQDFQVKRAQIDNIRAQTDNTRTMAVLNGLRSLQQGAQNWFNFGNRDLTLFDQGTIMNNYQLRQDLLKYQASVAKRTVDDQVRKIQLSNMQYGENIDLTKKKSIFQGYTNDFYKGNALAQIAGRLAPLLKFVH